MFCVVIVARNEGLESSRQPVDGRVVRGVILVRKDDMKVAIELGGGKVAKVSGNERQADQISLRALQRQDGLVCKL